MGQRRQPVHPIPRRDGGVELDADAEAVHAVRVVHRPHREQVLEELARLAVVCDLDVAVDAAAQRVLDDGDGLRLGARPLQEAAIAALRLVPLCMAAKDVSSAGGRGGDRPVHTCNYPNSGR